MHKYYRSFRVNNQKIVSNFTIKRLSSDDVEIVIPVSSMNPAAFDSFIFKGIPHGVKLKFLSEATGRAKELLLEGIPPNVLKKLYGSNIIKVTEQPPLNLSSGVTMLFVNERILKTLKCV